MPSQVEATALLVAINQGTDLLANLILLYASLPDSEEEARARFLALLPTLKAEAEWVRQYVPRTPQPE